ncbi:MAG: undecaprenyl-diphosphate phosphatase [Saprospiraceae bacterium]|nr:undecaprenyl-diphosphate phosphatase [Bacteroidia bacterium]NNE15544.1 undecaprenyl-diphosphate phosphatase [Saprospiraceae bacterium]NNL92561.1 undecaprenyl-diphosphate phosphatase [Saprospiraceae bacterium]
MSELIEAIILGLVQGITEFLPVSSSGHLEIFKFILGDKSLAEESMLTTVFLHFATALATIFVFRNEVLKLIRGFFNPSDQESKKYVLFIVISMIPAALVGFFFDDIIEQFFYQQLVLVGSCLIFTGFLLWISEKIKTQEKELNVFRATIIGISQAVGILPGVSRSGSTIATSLMLGIKKEEAARFSFLMVIPLIFGKIAKDLLSGDFMAHMPSVAYLILGFSAAFFTGIWACKFMVKIVNASKLSWFAIYCIFAGVTAIFVGM